MSTPSQPEREGVGRLINIEQTAREVGEVIKSALPPGVGFALLMYTFGEDGWMTYLSNGEREDMIKAMKELLLKLEKEPRG